MKQVCANAQIDAITLTPEQHAAVAVAVAEWPTCELCQGLGTVPGYPHHADNRKPCPACVAGRVAHPGGAGDDLMNQITLTPEQHARWVAAVAEWPTCPTCHGHGDIEVGEWAFGPVRDTCPLCVAGRVPQPVVLVIEGEPCPNHCAEIGESCQDCTAGYVLPVGWRVPAWEPVELRAYDLAALACGNEGQYVLVARATVELRAVVNVTWSSADVTPRSVTVELDNNELVMFDPAVVVPGRHWVAILEWAS